MAQIPSSVNDYGRLIYSISYHAEGKIMLEKGVVPVIFKQALVEHYTGNLLGHITALSFQARLDICKRLLAIVLKAHKHGIVHGCICAANVKLMSDSLYLENAGLFSEIQHQIKQVPLLPCTPYRSKEELESDEYSHSTSGDIYALTVLIYTIFAGKEPYSSTPLVQLVPKIANIGHNQLQKPEMMPETIWSALTGFWKVFPKYRHAAFEKVQAALEAY